MRLRGRGLRLTGVLALTVLALTGFSRGHGHGHSGHGSGGGGGCSSSRQDHDSTSSSGGSSGDSSGDSSDDSVTGFVPTYDPDDSYGSTDDDSSGSGSGGYRSPRTHRPTSSASSGGRSAEDGTVRVLSCATDAVPYATVEVTNPNKREMRYAAYVHFLNSSDDELAVGRVEVDVPARDSAQARVRVPAGAVDVDLDHCEAEPDAERVD
ncbi:hypothetical protein GTW40_10010 [Streptomyces sp. SID4985]|uniref:hypothetical protein n=1 Tax=Streptomyces sp. SID4985 TaxID=2690292 RepID=UPI00136F2347|nr:hypothetical protein [Streptomyces sp. SID4985]MYQ45390.1 hypothetical protein [Streptomyces sp. SID4985]